jgi:hypothetical protein
MQATSTDVEDFWSGTYRGRPIAILNQRDAWLVYLDHVLQHNMLFATADTAVAWLQRKIDRSKVAADCAE